MTKRRFILIVAGVELAIAVTMLLLPVWYARAVTAAYNSTVRVVNSAGTVIDGVASATTAAYNSTVRLVDSSGNVIDGFGTFVGGILAQSSGGTGAASLNAAKVVQTMFTVAGNPYAELDGLTFGVQNTTLASLTIPAGTLGIYDVMRCRFAGDFQNNSGGAQLLALSIFAGTAELTSGAATSVSTATGFHKWRTEMTFWNDGAANLNSADGFITLGAALNEGVGANSLANIFPGYSRAAQNTAADMTVKLGFAIGTATPVATPTPAPTAATTPIFRVFGAFCEHLPLGMTPTPTETPTPTPTP